MQAKMEHYHQIIAELESETVCAFTPEQVDAPFLPVPVEFDSTQPVEASSPVVNGYPVESAAATAPMLGEKTIQQQTDCQICMEAISDSTPMGFLENCSHVFCAPCLVT